MIKVYCGENIIVSRKAFLDEVENQKGKGSELIFFEGKTLTFPELILALEGKSLFNLEKTIAIENLFSSLKSKEKEKILKYLEVFQEKSPLILIWEGKEIGLKTFTGKPNFELKQYKISSSLFVFLDKLRPKETAKNLVTFHQCLKNEPPEMIFSMLVRQLRLLILAKESESNLGKLAEWQKRKILSQASSFTLENLKVYYKKLLEIDFQQKTSLTPFDLASELDLFLSDL